MADGKGLFEGIEDGAKALKAVMTVVLSLVVVAVLAYLIIGTITYQADQGNIPVSNGTVNNMTAVNTDLETAKDSVFTALGILLGFVSLAAVFILIKYLMGKGKNEGVVNF